MPYSGHCGGRAPDDHPGDHDLLALRLAGSGKCEFLQWPESPAWTSGLSPHERISIVYFFASTHRPACVSAHAALVSAKLPSAQSRSVLPRSSLEAEHPSARFVINSLVPLARGCGKGGIAG